MPKRFVREAAAEKNTELGGKLRRDKLRQKEELTAPTRRLDHSRSSIPGSRQRDISAKDRRRVTKGSRLSRTLNIIILRIRLRSNRSVLWAMLIMLGASLGVTEARAQVPFPTSGIRGFSWKGPTSPACARSASWSTTIFRRCILPGPDGNPTGFSVELARAACERLAITCTDPGPPLRHAAGRSRGSAGRCGCGRDSD